MTHSEQDLGRRDLRDIEKEPATNVCRIPGCCDAPMERRTFVKLAGLGTAALTAGATQPAAIAGPFGPEDVIDHCVPVEKKLKPDWVKSLTERGEPEVYQGADLETIGMPVGGIGAGQLYITGDGRLAHWDIFNLKTPGYGYPRAPLAPRSSVQQGFALHLESAGADSVFDLNADDFPDVSFRGAYPMATVTYRKPDCPLSVTLDAFSPFIPLNAADSALPATILQFKLKNESDKTVRGTLAGWLQNAVCHSSGGALPGDLVNQVVTAAKATTLLSTARVSTRKQPQRSVIRLAEFEGEDYGDWTVEGEAFGNKPATGTLRGQQKVDGYLGTGLVNTFLGGDAPQGKLTSPLFKIERRYISFLIGGGNHSKATCINLLVKGQVVRTATGKANEHLTWFNWNVSDLEGEEAKIEIVDQASGPWGHINIDQIEMSDKARAANDGPLETQPDFGSLALAVRGVPDATVSSCALPRGPLPDSLFADGTLANTQSATAPLGAYLCGALGQAFELTAGSTTTIEFVVAWNFPNRPESGLYYASRFDDAGDVAEYVCANFDSLARQTKSWVETYYDSTLPYWLLDRLHSTVSTLATSTCEIWKNGRFWAYEGVRCCHGTCGHVWNYEHALARLFPHWERTVREMQDFNPEAGYVEETGMIRFRGNWPDFWCGDAQTGYILKALREHQTSQDGAFLKRYWPRIRKSIEFLLKEDGDRDGLIEGQQHNTYDINFFGPNPMIGTLYLAALCAGEEMAREMSDDDFAATCRRVFEAGQRHCMEKMFNDEYFIQVVDLKEHPKHQHGDGCLSDQLFGQGWAHQVGLGYILPKQAILSTLQSIWKYNWAPDIAAQNEAHPPQRWFAYPGEAGLFTCTWPKSKHLGPESVLYRDEVWTGIEYQVAGNMAWEGMVTEALAICRGIHERYHPAKRNPWNEIECGDHYARGMASWGVLIGLAGFEFHGRKQKIGFAPRITPENFRSAFTAAAGWGTYSQQRDARRQSCRIDLRWGTLGVNTLALELPAGQRLRSATAKLNGSALDVTAKQTGSRVELAFSKPFVIEEGSTLSVELV